MTTWASLRDNQLRLLLKDADKTRWSDPELLMYANHALADLSGHVPIAKEDTLTAVAEQQEYSLPTDLLSVVAVILVDIHVQPFVPSPVVKRNQQDTTVIAYRLDWPEEGSIWFTDAPDDDVTLIYHAYRTPITGGTTELDIGRHRWMEEAICYYCCYLAYMREGVDRALLEQWARKQDLNVGNPLNVEAREWKLRYEEKITKNRPRSGR